eukprot:804886-Prorocentrum_minimum.AAC.2
MSRGLIGGIVSAAAALLAGHTVMEEQDDKSTIVNWSATHECHPKVFLNLSFSHIFVTRTRSSGGTWNATKRECISKKMGLSFITTATCTSTRENHTVFLPLQAYHQPESLKELEALVKGAHKAGKKLRPIGSALSPNGEPRPQ